MPALRPSFRGPPLETEPQPELQLARVERGGRLPETRQRGDARAVCVIRDGQVSTVEHVEAFGQQLHMDALGKSDATTHTQVERGEVEAAARVAANARGAVVVVRIVVAVVARQDVEGQARRVGEDVAQLKSSE